MAAVIEVPGPLTTLPAPAVPSAGRPPGAALRRAVVVALVAVLVLVGAALGLRAFSVSPASADVVPSGEYHVVGPGDTLWSIAGSFDASGPRAPVVAMLAELNGGDTSVELGEVIALPAMPG